MKAVRLHQFGGPEVLRLEEIPTPSLKPGEVLVNNIAAGVNPIDWKTRSGGGVRQFLGEPPLILGWECAGVVEAVADNVTAWQPGDRVFGLLNFPQAGNCYAERVAAPGDQLAALPTPIPFALAAGLPIAGLTAWQALFEQADLQAGQTALVLAAAGGVGHLAVQLAKWKGATVFGTASANNRQRLAELGCDQVFDYHQGNLGAQVQDVDVIIDGVGGQAAIDALRYLKPEGTLVTLPTVTAAAVCAAAEQSGRRASGFRVTANPAQLAQLARLMAEGHLQLQIDRSFPLSETAEAHRYSEMGHARGKIILEIGFSTIP